MALPFLPVIAVRPAYTALCWWQTTPPSSSLLDTLHRHGLMANSLWECGMCIILMSAPTTRLRAGTCCDMMSDVLMGSGMGCMVYFNRKVIWMSVWMIVAILSGVNCNLLLSWGKKDTHMNIFIRTTDKSLTYCINSNCIQSCQLQWWNWIMLNCIILYAHVL